MRRILLIIACLFAAIANAQDYPARTVKMVVPIGPGGGTDILARHMAQKLSERLRQPFVVENRPGAGSIVGTEYVARSAPDGYTLLVGGIFNMVMNKALVKNLSYEPARDFVPLGYISAYPFALVARNDIPAEGLADFVRHAAERPGKLTTAPQASAACSTSGARSSSRCSGSTWCTCRSRRRRRCIRRCSPAVSTS
jgi:tripartite-type tricarboxylate transporter receptor subunit TctC